MCICVEKRHARIEVHEVTRMKSVGSGSNTTTAALPPVVADIVAAVPDVANHCPLPLPPWPVLPRARYTSAVLCSEMRSMRHKTGGKLLQARSMKVFHAGAKSASIVLEQDHFYSDSKPFTCTHVALSICDDVGFVAGITSWSTSI